MPGYTIDEIRLGEGSDIEAPNIEFDYTVTSGQVESKKVTFVIEGRGDYTHDLSEGATYYMPQGTQGSAVTFRFEVTFQDGETITKEVSDTLTYGRVLTPNNGNGENGNGEVGQGGGQNTALAIAAIGAVGAGAFIISRRV